MLRNNSRSTVNAMNKLLKILFAALFIALAISTSWAEQRYITLASATTTENSGLYDAILPIFTRETSISVRVVSVGTGHALNIAKDGDADVLLVHHKPTEEQFVAEDYGIERHNVMFNHFVLIGPKNDPAGIAGVSKVQEALRRIAHQKSLFASRGDNSGTHKKEMSLWQQIGIDPDADSGEWYSQVGAGMSATLNYANNRGAYVLTDKATWLRLENRISLDLLIHDESSLLNQYGVILVNPDIHPHINVSDGQIFVDWILSEHGQTTINAYHINNQQAFFANAP